MNHRTDSAASPWIWALLWLAASSTYLAVVYQPFTPDSYVYVAAARTALDSGCFCLPFAPTSATTLPTPLEAWPPGYPALIAGLSATGLDPWLASVGIAALSVFLAVLGGALWLRRWPGGTEGLACACLCSMTAVVSVTAWSEGPFVLALGIACAGAVLWNDSQSNSRVAAWTACIGLASALLLRHAGWFVVPVFAWHLLRTSERGRLLKCVAIAFSVLPAAFWLAQHAPGFDATESFDTLRLFRSTGETAAALGKLAIVPWSGWVALQAILGVVLVCALGLLQWRTRPTHSSFTRLAWHTGWSLVCGTWLVGVANPAQFFATDRLLWPAWVFLALAAGSSLRPPRGRVLLVAMSFLLVTQTAGVIRLPGLEPRHLDSKQDFQPTAQLLANQTVVSNEAWRAWRLAGCSGYYLPRTHQATGVLAPDTLSTWAAARGVRYLVWFHDGLSEQESLRRYGPLASAGYGKTPDVLELVAMDAVCHTYLIHGPGVH